MNVIVALIYFLQLFPGSKTKTACFVKLKSVTPTYVNHTLVDFDVNVVPHNKSINVYNQTLMFKFNVITENILLLDVSSYRITKSNRTFLLSHLIMPLKETVTMEQIDVGTMWRDYTRPQLIWPPQINVTYRTFGWTIDVSKFPSVIPSGDVKILLTLRFRNQTKVYVSKWIVNVIYQ